MKNLPKSTLTKSQVITKTKDITYYGKPAVITAEIRHDDQCGSGHNSFSITGSIKKKGRHEPDICGCIHEEIKKHFPELAPFIKWHLTSTDEPMHYVANTVYLAGAKDYNGLYAGETKVISYTEKLKFGNFPKLFNFRENDFKSWIADQNPDTLEIEAQTHPDNPKTFSPNYTFRGIVSGRQWYGCPFHTKEEAEEFILMCKWEKPVLVKTPDCIRTGQGKEPELSAARRAAIWPDATQEQLTDKKALEQRLPALMREFKKDVESLGLKY